MRRSAIVGCLTAAVALLAFAPAAVGGGQEEDDPSNNDTVPVPTTVPSTEPRPTTADTAPTTTLPGATTLPTLPPECDPAPPADAIFVGELEAAAGGVGRFDVEAVRRDPDGHVAIGALVDVRLGDDVRFLVLERLYLVSAAVDDDGRLVSKVVEPQVLFGGDQIVGLNDADPDCPAFVDPIVVRNGDGSSVDTAVFGGFTDDKRGIALAFGIPALIVFGALLGLVIFKHTLIGVWRGLLRFGRGVTRGSGRAGPPPIRQSG